jgi:subtilisin family serine protease
LLDQSLPPKQWRGIKQPATDAQAPLREWLVFSRNLAEAQSQRQALQPFALSILRRQQLGELGRVISVYRIPDSVDLQQLETRLRQQFPDWLQELNLRYLPLSDALEDGNDDPLERWGQHAVGQTQLSPANCSAGLVLAMLDGPVNPNLAAFAGAALSYQSVVSEAFRPRSLAADRHGNGIAALLVGQQQVRGLIPGASVYALGVFGDDAEVGLHTRTDWLLSGLDRLLALPAPVQVVNLSFGGGYSRLLESIVQRLQSRMQFVAAAGNDGTEGLRYPAAYPGVVAVGAVDARLQRLRQSNFGAGLSLVAPGEDIWTLDEQGQGYFASGTSLAAPFVSAALALNGSLEQLRMRTKDLGPAGEDHWYGAGLVQLPGCR